jgi:hypothetical protein
VEESGELGTGFLVESWLNLGEESFGGAWGVVWVLVLHDMGL